MKKSTTTTSCVVKIIWLCLLSFLLLNMATLTAQEAKETQVLGQKRIGPNGCGPCALINSLSAVQATEWLSNLEGASQLEKAKAFIERYGDADSVYYGKRKKAYTDESGIADKDLLAMVNRFAKDSEQPEVVGEYLIRLKDQAPEEFTKSFHNKVKSSIEQGFHPLLSIRALAAELDEDRGRFLWNSKGGHWISIHSIGDLSNNGKSISLGFSDSISGRRQTGVVFFNGTRRASVPIKFSVDEAGKEQWTWIDNGQTLELFAPGMPLGTVRAKWYQRAFIAVRYIVIRPEKKG